MIDVLVDTNVFLYARGADHPHREPSRAVLRAAADDRVRLHASVELVQEYLHVLRRRLTDPGAAVAEAGAVARQCVLHPFDERVLTEALGLVARYELLDVRDAVCAATAVTSGLGLVCSTDADLDGIDGLERRPPAVLVAGLA